MKVLIDVNLSPEWCNYLRASGIEAIHWSTVGALTASDEEIMRFACENGYIVFTHDLDFSTILALTGDDGPSVVQMRTQDVMAAAHHE